MWTAGSNTKCCATCANWAGNRKLRGPLTVETDSCNDRAKCYAGVFCGNPIGPNPVDGRSCNKYSKWAALK